MKLVYTIFKDVCKNFVNQCSLILALVQIITLVQSKHLNAHLWISYEILFSGDVWSVKLPQRYIQTCVEVTSAAGTVLF